MRVTATTRMGTSGAFRKSQRDGDESAAQDLRKRYRTIEILTEA
jgi:hypothetical protein